MQLWLKKTCSHLPDKNACHTPFHTPPHGGKFIEADVNALSRFTNGISPVRDDKIPSGAEFFEAVETDPSYYPNRDEQEILICNADTLARTFSNTDLIEWGPGDGNKTSTLLRLIGDQLVGRYIGVDCSPSFLDMTKRAISSIISLEKCLLTQSDFRQCAAVLPQRLPNSSRGAVFIGTTVGNPEPEEAITLLRYLSGEVLRPGEAAWIGADSTRNSDVLAQAYGNDVTAQFFLNGLMFAARSAGLSGLDYNAFNYEIRFNQLTDFVEMDLVSQKRQTMIDADGNQAVLEDQEPIRVGQSRKPSAEKWRQIYGLCGFAVEGALTYPGKRSDYNIWQVRALPGGQP